jgi:VanZ like family
VTARRERSRRARPTARSAARSAARRGRACDLRGSRGGNRNHGRAYGVPRYVQRVATAEREAGRAAWKYRAIGGALIVVHLFAIWWLALRPTSVTWVDATNLQLLATIRAELARGAWEALRAIGGSLLLLAPCGILLPLAAGRLDVSPVASFVRTVLAGALLSLTVELLKTGIPGQVANVDAILLNTAGVALAHAAVVPAVRARLRRGRTRPGNTGAETQGETPRITRVGIAP